MVAEKASIDLKPGDEIVKANALLIFAHFVRHIAEQCLEWSKACLIFCYFFQVADGS
jgi:hypothetical protein